MSEWLGRWTCNLADSPVAEVGKLLAVGSRIPLPRGPPEKGEFKGILRAKGHLEFIRMTVTCSCFLWRIGNNSTSS